MSRDLRMILHSAFTAVQSGEVNSSTAPVTIDHVIEEQIRFLKPGQTRAIVDSSGGGQTRVSRYDQLERLRQDLDAVISAIQDAKGNEDVLQAMDIYEADQEADV